MDAAGMQAHRETDIDPITLEVIRHGIISITNQIDANITRTAFSPYIYEYKDFAVGLLNADGYLVAQCTGGMPPFVADAVGTAVRDGLSVHGRALYEGDVLLCNHAAVQGQHLNNTVMYTPIFAGAGRDTLVGFFAINVHWIDIGGAVPKSTDIFMEGLQLRSIKLWSKGKPNDDVYRIIESNTRFPVELLGDISAQLAGCLLGRDLTLALIEKYGTDTFLDAVETVLCQGEAAARQKIRDMPDGIYEAESYLDNDGEANLDLPVKVRVVIDGDEITIDYSGIADQVKGCINSGYYGGGMTTARVAFKYVVLPREPANEGVFRPLRLVLPEGKILSAPPTAPMGNYSMPFPTVIDTVVRALGRALPEQATGGHFGTHSGFRIYGRAERTGVPFMGQDSGHGGWGACASHDGSGPFRTMAHGDTRNIPVELQESILPIRVDEFSLRENSGGSGKFRGGLGVRKVYRILAPCFLQTNLDRTKCPPWGVHGGHDGQPGRVTIIRSDTGEADIVNKGKGYKLNAGDIACLETGGGGGYGSPTERPRELIERDLERGYVTPEAAERDYGKT